MVKDVNFFTFIGIVMMGLLYAYFWSCVLVDYLQDPYDKKYGKFIVLFLAVFIYFSVTCFLGLNLPYRFPCILTTCVMFVVERNVPRLLSCSDFRYLFVLLSGIVWAVRICSWMMPPKVSRNMISMKHAGHGGNGKNVMNGNTAANQKEPEKKKMPVKPNCNSIVQSILMNSDEFPPSRSFEVGIGWIDNFCKSKFGYLHWIGDTDSLGRTLCYTLDRIVFFDAIICVFIAYVTLSALMNIQFTTKMIELAVASVNCLHCCISRNVNYLGILSSLILIKVLGEESLFVIMDQSQFLIHVYAAAFSYFLFTFGYSWRNFMLLGCIFPVNQPVMTAGLAFYTVCSDFMYARKIMILWYQIKCTEEDKEVVRKMIHIYPINHFCNIPDDLELYRKWETSFQTGESCTLEQIAQQEGERVALSRANHVTAGTEIAHLYFLFIRSNTGFSPLHAFIVARRPYLILKEEEMRLFEYAKKKFMFSGVFSACLAIFFYQFRYWISFDTFEYRDGLGVFANSLQKMQSDGRTSEIIRQFISCIRDHGMQIEDALKLSFAETSRLGPASEILSNNGAMDMTSSNATPNGQGKEGSSIVGVCNQITSNSSIFSQKNGRVEQEGRDGHASTGIPSNGTIGMSDLINNLDLTNEVHTNVKDGQGSQTLSTSSKNGLQSNVRENSAVNASDRNMPSIPSMEPQSDSADASRKRHREDNSMDENKRSRVDEILAIANRLEQYLNDCEQNDPGNTVP